MKKQKILRTVYSLIKPTLSEELALEFEYTIKIVKNYHPTVINAPHQHIQQSVDFIVHFVTSADYSESLIGTTLNNYLFFANATQFKSIFIDENWLTIYEAEGDFVKVIDFQGDSWFEDFPNKSGMTVPNRYEIIDFHIELTKRFNKESNPIKKRELAFSIYTLERRFRFKYLTSSLPNTYYLFRDELIEVIKNNIKNVNRYSLPNPIRTLMLPTIDEWFQVKSIFYPIVFLGLLIFMYPFSQLDLRPPTLQYKPLVFEIGATERPLDYITTDSEGYLFEGSLEMIKIHGFDETKLLNPNIINFYYDITDPNANSRLYPVSMTVQDTTKPIINRTNLSPSINFEDLDGFDFFKFIRVTDNHRIDEEIAFIPVALSEPLTYFPIGQYQIEFRVTDESGNNSNYQTSVFIEDNTAPIIKFKTTNPSFRIELFEEASLRRLIESVSDNYRSDLVTVSITNDYIQDNVGIFNVTYTAIDANNNSITEAFEFEVYDRTPPTVEFIEYNPIISITDTKLMTFSPEQFILNASDNYQIKAIYQSDTTSPFILRQFFDYVVYVEDYGGNIVSKRYRLILLDTMPPIINLLTNKATYRADSYILDSISNETIQRLFISSLQDNFRGTVSLDVIWPVNVNRGDNALRLIATDSSGNSSYKDVILTLE